MGATILEIRRPRAAEPSSVFTADGQRYDVGRLEHVGQTPSGRLITIGLDDDSTVTLGVPLVAGSRKPIPEVEA